LLAQRGKKVVLVEKDNHPRFHIGESLLPMNLPLFEALGVKEAIGRIGMPKYGVEFVSHWHDETTLLDFAQYWDTNLFYSYQVRRVRPHPVRKCRGNTLDDDPHAACSR